MTPIRVEASPVEPVSVAELRAYLRLPDGRDAGENAGQEDAGEAPENGLLADLIAAARAGIELETRRLLVPGLWRIILDRWPAGGVLALPLSPLAALVRAGFALPGGAVDPFEPDFVRLGPDPVEAPCLVFGPGAPDLAGRVALVEVEAGFGGSGLPLPPPLRLAVLRLAAGRYEHRGDEPDAPDPAALALPYRRLRL